MAKPKTEAAKAAGVVAPTGGDAGGGAAAKKPAGTTVTYTPGDGDPVKVTWMRIEFHANKPVLVSDERLIARARENPWFKVEGSAKAVKGFDPAVDEPEDATQYRAYAITWIKTATKSAEMKARWAEEEELRGACGVGTDDLEYLARYYDPKLEQVEKAEKDEAQR